MSAYLSIDTGRVRTLKGVFADLADWADDVLAQRLGAGQGRPDEMNAAALRDHRADACDGC